MLFFITATHSSDNCPMYDESLQAKVHEFTTVTAPKLAEELSVSIHAVLSPIAEHELYLVLESDNPAAVTKLLMAMPIKQDFHVKTVVNVMQGAK